MNEWEQFSSSYVKLVLNKPQVLEIKSIDPQAKGKYNLKQQGKDLGYHIALETDKGTLSVNTWGLVFACKGSGVKVGHTYEFTKTVQGGLGKVSKYQIIEIGASETKQVPKHEIFKGTSPSEDVFKNQF